MNLSRTSGIECLEPVSHHPGRWSQALGATTGLALMGAGLIGCGTGARTAAEAAPATDAPTSTTGVAPTTTAPPTTVHPAPTTTVSPAPTMPVSQAPTTTVSPATPTTTVSPAPTTTGPSLPSDAAGYVRATYDAWAAGDRDAAALVADPAAIDSLFARTWSEADGWVFLRCEGAAGSVFCVWQRPGEQLLIKARNASGGVPVSAVEFRAAP